jgi:putative flippase GtrA
VEASGYAGVSFYETKFEQLVPIDPAIAAIIGVSSAKQVSYSLNHIPTFAGRLSKTVPRGVFSFGAARAITPGNGLFLTSSSTSLDVGYSYTGLKKWGISTGAAYITSNSVGNVIGTYRSYSLSANVSRQIFPSTHAVFGFGASKYGSPDFRNYNTWSYNIHAGLGFTPGDVPIRLW